ncbi:PIN domain-containing protein [Streptomyces sp. NPDC001515]
MLVTPLPGTDRDHLLRTLDTVRIKIDNLRGPFTGTSYSRLVLYLRWATESARLLRNLVRTEDMTRLVLTRRYDALLSGAAGGFAGSHQEALLNDLISLEMEERVAELGETAAALRKQGEDWGSEGVLVVADSSVYIQHEFKLLDWNFHSLLDIREEHVRLLFPMVIVDELDNLKQSKERVRRWRAAYTLAVLDKHLTQRSDFAVIKAADYSGLESGGVPHGRVAVEILFDPPGHSRLPINDDEIVDRAAMVQLVAARPVRLLTYDTGQAMRARAAGLRVHKLRPAAESEPDPAISK